MMSYVAHIVQNKGLDLSNVLLLEIHFPPEII